MKRLFYPMVFSILLCLSALLSYAAVPSLPLSLQQKARSLDGDSANPKMVLLDFYSTYCGTCQMMAPYLKVLASETSHRLHIAHINIDAPTNQKTYAAFDIQGTPTYILYNTVGQPLYRMQNLIAPIVLDRQVLRITQQLKQIPFPESVKLVSPKAVDLTKNTDLASHFSSMILVSFENKNCKACQPMTPYLQGFELTGQKGLQIIHLDTASQDGRQLMKQLAISELPAYALFDNGFEAAYPRKSHLRFKSGANTRGELFQVSGSIQPHALWEMIRMFGDNGL